MLVDVRFKLVLFVFKDIKKIFLFILLLNLFISLSFFLVLVLLFI